MVEGDAGKPALDPAAGLPDLRFNLSHSGDRALIAIAEGVELGVDLERITPKRDRGYLEDWTRREAYAKGAGSGLAGGVRQLAFEPLADGTWGVLDGGRRIDGWRILDLDVGSGLVAAIAVESEVDVSLRLDPAVA